MAFDRLSEPRSLALRNSVKYFAQSWILHKIPPETGQSVVQAKMKKFSFLKFAFIRGLR